LHTVDGDVAARRLQVEIETTRNPDPDRTARAVVLAAILEVGRDRYLAGATTRVEGDVVAIRARELRFDDQAVFVPAGDLQRPAGLRVDLEQLTRAHVELLPVAVLGLYDPDEEQA
jgi:hypothetical protein